MGGGGESVAVALFADSIPEPLYKLSVMSMLTANMDEDMQGTAEGSHPCSAGGRWSNQSVCLKYLQVSGVACWAQALTRVPETSI